jgi:hypothetical protein
MRISFGNWILCYWTWPIEFVDLHINTVIFQFVVLVYQRVIGWKPHFLNYDIISNNTQLQNPGWCFQLVVSWNGGTPKSSILDWDVPWNKPCILEIPHQSENPQKWKPPVGYVRLDDETFPLQRPLQLRRGVGGHVIHLCRTEDRRRGDGNFHLVNGAFITVISMGISGS